jgi:hypothetical protein
MLGLVDLPLGEMSQLQRAVRPPMLNKGTETRSLSPVTRLLPRSHVSRAATAVRGRRPVPALQTVERLGPSPTYALERHAPYASQSPLPDNAHSTRSDHPGGWPRRAGRVNPPSVNAPTERSGRPGFGGDAQNRTGDGGFADLCLATWLRRRASRSILLSQVGWPASRLGLDAVARARFPGRHGARACWGCRRQRSS